MAMRGSCRNMPKKATPREGPAIRKENSKYLQLQKQRTNNVVGGNTDENLV